MAKFDTWLPLSPGDSIEMVATGFPFSWEHIKASEKILSAWSYHLSYPKSIQGRHSIYANSHEQRLATFLAAAKSDAKVIWAARGGYGSLHLLEALKKIRPSATKKLLIGFSDNSTLQQFVTQEWGWVGLHGPHVDRISFLNTQRLKELREILSGKKTELHYPGLKPLNLAAQKNQNIIASIVGGNLITTQSTLGTPWQINTQGKIVFFEDIGERGYKVARVLEHMRLAGVFKKSKAIIFGPFTGGDEPDGSNKVLTAIKEFSHSTKVPVLMGLKSGHIPNSLSLPLNTKAKLHLGSKARLSVSTGCCL